jgi:hypothetical protein
MKVYVHGNCQAPAIASMIANDFPQWDVFSYEVFGDDIIGPSIDHYYELARTADIIISQPIHLNYRGRDDLSLSWLRNAAKRSAHFVVYPSMYFDGQLIGWRSIGIPAYGMDYHDLLLVHLTNIGLGVDRIAALLLDEHLYTDEFISSEINLSISEMQRREAVDNVDIPLSPHLMKYGNSVQIFHAINHPYRSVFAYVANEILKSLGYKASIDARGRECLPFPHVPLPPAVTRYLRQRKLTVEWSIESEENYHFPKELLSRIQYYERAITHLRKYPRDHLLGCLRAPLVRPFLERLAAFNSRLPGIGMWTAKDRAVA